MPSAALFYWISGIFIPQHKDMCYGSRFIIFQEWFHETVLNDFQEDFVADISPDAPLR